MSKQGVDMSRLNSVARQPASPDAPQARMIRRQASLVLVSGAATGARFSMVETLEAQGAEPLRHCHHWEDETLYVLEGELAVYCDGAWTHTPAGAVAVLPRGSEHSFAVLSESARVLSVFVPAGFEAWYRDVGTATPWSGEVEHIVATAARYGCEITGPHPGRPQMSDNNQT